MIGFAINQYLSVSDINLAADAIAVNRGYGAFDFFGVINGTGFYFERHLDRFFNSMQLMRLHINFSKSEVKSIIERLFERNNKSNFYIKLFAYPLKDFSGKKIQSELFVLPVMMPVDNSFDYKNGVKLISKEYQRFLPEAKSTNYLPLVYWQNEISDAKAADVLYYSQGSIRESSRGNVFLVLNGEVLTPGSKILRGITRSVVMDLLNDNGVSVIEKEIPFGLMLKADEIFLSSTTKKILPVTQVDENTISNGSVGQVSSLLIQKFEELQKNSAR